MHELGIMSGVMDAAREAAENAGALRVIKVSLRIGEMTEAIRDALEFAFQALQELPENALFAEAEFEVDMVRPKSRCLECGAEYTHDRFHMLCPECGSFATQLLEGRELEISSIEVDLPDEDAEEDGGASDGAPDESAAAAEE